MRGERITGTILFAAVLLVGILFCFVTFGYTTATEDGTTVTESYTPFMQTREVAPKGDLDNPSSTTSTSFFDANMDGTGGITYMRIAGPLFLASMVATAVALTLTILPRTTDTRAGGYVGIAASAGYIFSTALLAVGIQWHLVQSSTVNDVLAKSTGMYLAVVFLLFMLIATGMGLVRSHTRVIYGEARAASNDWDAPFGDDEDGEATPTRLLQCPDCSLVVEVDVGFVPTCPDCGFAGRTIQGETAPLTPTGATAD